MKWIFTSVILALVIAVVLLSYRVYLSSVNLLLLFLCLLLLAVLIFFGYLSRKEQQTALHQEVLEELQNKYNTLQAQYNSTTYSLNQRVEVLEKMNKDQQKELAEWKASVENWKTENNKKINKEENGTKSIFLIVR